MGEKAFKFISPGIYVEETDNSQISSAPGDMGPLIIGRTEKGPGMEPITINSLKEFVEIFGNPIPGGRGGDVWRDGNYASPTYGAYAAKAWLKNNSPVKFVRVLGSQHTDATTAGKAGWQTTATTPDSSEGSNGGAFGLFIINSSSTADCSDVTGSLAAVFYLNEGSMTLSGNLRGSTTGTDAAATLIESVDSSCKFTAVIRDSGGTIVEKSQLNFAKNSQLFARKVFNTNPVLTNNPPTNTANQKKYWLGETFETHLADHVTLSQKCFGVILGLSSGSVDYADHRFGSQAAKSGWVFSQDLTTNYASYDGQSMTKLFRIVARNSGEWEQKNLKITIEDIEPSSNSDNDYGTFTVKVRKANDSDNAQVVLESFTNCNLNPYSKDYVAAKIGDMYKTWSDNERDYTEYGNFPNVSSFIYVEMNADVDAGSTDPLFLPFGFYGHPRMKGFGFTSGSITLPTSFGATNTATTFANSFVVASGSIPRGPTTFGKFVQVCPAGLANVTPFTGSYYFPKIQTRSSSFDGNLANPTAASFGADATEGTSTNFDKSWGDVLRAKPSGVSSYVADGTTTEYAFIFSLDDLKAITGGGNTGVHWVSGSRALGTSLTAATGSWSASLDLDYNSFTLPIFGGFDGIDIKENEPFRNSKMSSTSTVVNNYVYNSWKQAMDSAADSELHEYNLAAAPGLTNESLTTHLINICDDRGSAMAVIDLEGDYTPRAESTTDSLGSVSTTITNLKNRSLNTSYGAAYFPWVRVRDEDAGALFWGPPSIAAIGAMSNTQKTAELWFAPAGFTRGGLSKGDAGIPIIDVRQRLKKKERDALYLANINPIAKFPAEGVVIYGQKTLQKTQSALDRVNVRRLMNHLKTTISRVAKMTLFEPNIRVTWNNFISKADPILSSIQSRFGISEYKLILDETTTTPDLIDRNIVYAKLFIKPTRTIEAFFIDFVVTNEGAAFDD